MVLTLSSDHSQHKKCEKTETLGGLMTRETQNKCNYQENILEMFVGLWEF